MLKYPHLRTRYQTVFKEEIAVVEHSASSAYAIMKRERDSAHRNVEFWKRRCTESMEKEHSKGVTVGIIMASGVYGVIATLAAIMFW